MVDIAINSASERRALVSDFGIESGEWLYILQYDLPGIDLPDRESTGAHHHVIPVLAVADYMMATGSDSIEDAVEFCVMDRVQAIYADEELDAQGVNKQRGQDIADRSRSMAEMRMAMREAIVGAATSIDIGPDDSLTELIDSFYESLASSSSTSSSRIQFSDAVNEARSRASEEKGRISGVIVDKSSNGWNTVQTLAMNATQKIEEAKRKSFDIRYADSIHQILTNRFIEMGKFNESR